MAALALALSTAACVTVRAVSVSELAANLRAFNGEVVAIRGWLDRCDLYSCGLFATKSEAERRHYGPQMLSVASTRDFDREALGKGPAEVIIKAKVDASCRSEQVICMDRASELRPISIQFLGKD